MNQIPDWWLGISAAFFILNIVLFIGLIIAIFKVVAVVKAIQPKIEALTTKVESVAQKVEDLTTTTRQTVEVVGGKAKSITTSIERVTHTAAAQFERFSPFLVGGLTALRLFNAYKQSRQAQAAQQHEE